MATTTAISEQRSELRRANRETKYMESRLEHEVAAWNDINEILDAELNALPEACRAVIVSHYLEGRTQVEVAEQLGIPRTTVSSRILKGLGLLERKLKSRGVVVPAAALSGMMASEMSHAAPASLAETMGKAVLRGAFRTRSKTTPILRWASVAGVVAGIALLAFFAGNRNGAEPILEGATPPVVSAMAVAPASPPVEVEPPRVEFAVAQSDESPESDDALPTFVEPLPETKQIRLQCVDESGNPLADVQVYVFQRHHDASPMILGNDRKSLWAYQSDTPLTSDSEGYVTFDSLDGPEGGTVVNVACAVLPNQRVGIWTHRNRGGVTPPEDESRIVMAESKTVPGQIVLPEGYYLSTVHVDTMYVRIPTPTQPYASGFGSYKLGSAEIFPGLFEVSVDATGKFEVANLPKEGAFNVRARGVGLGERQMHVLDASLVDFIELRMAAHGVITGRVSMDGSGASVSDRKVFAHAKLGQGITRAHIGITDVSGIYRIEGLHEGEYRIFVGIETFPSEYTSHAKIGIKVETGLVTDNVDFVVERGQVITGTMVNKETGDPIEGVGVAALSPAAIGGAVIINAAISDTNGRYEMRLPVNNIMLYISKVPKGTLYPKDQARRTVAVAAGSGIPDPIDFFFKSDGTDYPETGFGTVTGRALDQNGKPIADVLVMEERKYKQGEDMRQTGRRRLGRSGGDGRFSVQVQVLGQHKITVGGYEWSAHRGDWFEVAKDETKALDDVVLRQYTMGMSILVLDVDGDPISDATYEVDSGNFYDTSYGIKSGFEGMIYLKNLPETEIYVGVNREGYEPSEWEGLAGQHIEMVMKKQ